MSSHPQHVTDLAEIQLTAESDPWRGSVHGLFWSGLGEGVMLVPKDSRLFDGLQRVRESQKKPENVAPIEDEQFFESLGQTQSVLSGGLYGIYDCVMQCEIEFDPYHRGIVKRVGTAVLYNFQAPRARFTWDTMLHVVTGSLPTQPGTGFRIPTPIRTQRRVYEALRRQS